MGSLLFGGYEKQVAKKAPFSHDIPAATTTTAEKKAEEPIPAAVAKPVAATDAPVNKAAPVSSNKFANGANQNSGNFISERPTTRIHAAPGGGSSMGSLL